MDQNTNKTKTLVIFALFSSLISIALHSYLTMNHFLLKYGLSAEKSFCNINATFNCDIVSTSQFASFLGLPIALWGACTHLVLSLMLSLYLIGLVSHRDRVLRLGFLLSAFVMFMSILMGSISFAIMHTYCLFCIFTYILSIFIGFSLYLATKSHGLSSLKKDIKSLFSDHIWVSILLVMIPVSSFLTRSIILDSYGLTKIEEAIRDSLQNWKTAPDKTFDMNSGLIYQKDNNSIKMVIVEFADYLCPHCKSAAKPLHDYASSHNGVKLVFKPFPLDGTCNESPGMPKHDGVRCTLPYAVFCAEEIAKKGWDVHEYIFEHQGQWNFGGIDSDLNKMSEKLSLNFTQLKECMNKTETYTKVMTLAKEGAGIQGTPTIFVNGKLLERAQFPPVLEAAGVELGL